MSHFKFADFALRKARFLISLLLVTSILGVNDDFFTWVLPAALLLFHLFLFWLMTDNYHVYKFRYWVLSHLNDAGLNSEPPCGLDGSHFKLNYKGFIGDKGFYDKNKLKDNLDLLILGDMMIESPSINGHKVSITWNEKNKNDCFISINFKGTSTILPMSGIGRANLVNAFNLWNEYQCVFARKTGSGLYHAYGLIELVEMMSVNPNFKFDHIERCVIAGEISSYTEAANRVSVILIAAFSILPFIYGRKHLCFTIAFLLLSFPALSAFEGFPFHNSMLRYIKRKLAGEGKTPSYKYLADTDFKWCNIVHRTELVCNSSNRNHFYIMESDILNLPRGFHRDLAGFQVPLIGEIDFLAEKNRAVTLTAYYWDDQLEEVPITGSYEGNKHINLVLSVEGRRMPGMRTDMCYEKLKRCYWAHKLFSDEGCCGVLTEIRRCIDGYDSHCMDLIAFITKVGKGENFYAYTTLGNVTVGDRMFYANPVDFAVMKSGLKLSGELSKFIVHNQTFFSKKSVGLKFDLIIELLFKNFRVFSYNGVGSGVLKRYVAEFTYLASRLGACKTLRNYQKERLPSDLSNLDKLIQEPSEKIRVVLNTNSEESILEICEELDQDGIFSIESHNEELQSAKKKIERKTLERIKGDLKKVIDEAELLCKGDCTDSEAKEIFEILSRDIPIDNHLKLLGYKEVLKAPLPLVKMMVKTEVPGGKGKKSSAKKEREDAAAIVAKKERIEELEKNKKVMEDDLEEISKIQVIDKETFEKYRAISFDIMRKMNRVDEPRVLSEIIKGTRKAVTKKQINDSMAYKGWEEKLSMMKHEMNERASVIGRVEANNYHIRVFNEELESLKSGKVKKSSQNEGYQKVVRKKMKKRFTEIPNNLKLKNRFDPLTVYLMKDEDYVKEKSGVVFAKVESDVCNKTLKIAETEKKGRRKKKKKGKNVSGRKPENMMWSRPCEIEDSDFYREMKTLGGYINYKKCNMEVSDFCLKSELFLFKRLKEEESTKRPQSTVYNRAFAVFDSIMASEPLNKKEKLEAYKKRINLFRSNYDRLINS